MTPNSVSESHFGQSAFWARLHQALYVAVVTQQPISLDLDLCRLDTSLSHADDHVWANRMAVHMANVVQYCFGHDRPASIYDSLCEYSSRWMSAIPSSFSPVFARHESRDGCTFPEILLLSYAAVIGLQYYHLARMLLTAHNPKTPRLGKGQRLWAIRMAVSSDAPIYLAIGMNFNMSSLGRAQRRRRHYLRHCRVSQHK